MKKERMDEQVNIESSTHNEIDLNNRKTSGHWNKKPHVRRKGISMVTLVLTIVVMLILAGIAFVVSDSVVADATHAKYSSEVADIEHKVQAKREENTERGPGEEIKNYGFTKVLVEDAPADFVSFDEDMITGYWVNLDTIQEENIQNGREKLTELKIKFNYQDVYVYDARGKVYYAKGWYDGDDVLHYRVDSVQMADSDESEKPEIVSVTYELSENRREAILTVVANPKNGGTLEIVVGGRVATKVGENIYTVIVKENGVKTVLVTESMGGRASEKIDIVGIEVVKDTTPPDITSLTSRIVENSVLIEGKAEESESNIIGYKFTTSPDEPTDWNSVNSLTISVSHKAISGGIYYLWAKNADGLVSSESINVTLPETYTIRYNANGGSLGNVASSQKKMENQNIVLDPNSPTRTGYTFKGWGVASNSTAAKYQPGEMYTANASLDLFAIWEADIYTITYDANGGSGAPANETKVHGESKKISEIIPIKEGYIFKGWSINSASPIVAYNAGAVYTGDADLNLYAVWAPKTYIITYNANGGNSAPANEIKNHGEIKKLSEATPKREGYTFQGWATSSSSTTVAYNAGATYTGNADLDLYAVWNANVYTITYNANGGDGAPGSDTKTHGENKRLSTETPNKEGYTFQGWATSSSLITVAYNAGDLYTGNADLNLYAVWKAKTYTITYNANGGKGAPENDTKIHGENKKLSDVVPTREGYTFKGWGTMSTSTVATCQPGATYTGNEDLNLYAVWQIKTYIIKYNANGGSGAPGDDTKEYNENKKLSTVIPTREGYAFKGWAVGSNSTLVEYNAGDYYTENENLNLYAVWKTNTYTITYNANGGSLGDVPSTQTKEYGASIAINENIPVREGYTFKGWGTSDTAVEVAYQPGDTYSSNSNTTLFAMWGIQRDSIGSIPNKPVIDSTQMQAVYWSDENASKELTASSFTTEMYNYKLGTDLSDNRESKWANAKTIEDGSYWVWIPRYAYKITYTNADKTEITTTNNGYGNIDVLFMYGTSNTHYRDGSGEAQLLPEGYVVHPAFQAMSTTEDKATNPLGKWDSDLEGIWVAKYEVSKEVSNDGINWTAATASTSKEGNILTTNAGNTSAKIRMVSKPSVSAWRSIRASNMYQNSENMFTTLNSHLMKNSEWGAVAYLTYSPYGRNGNELALNECTSYYTGAGPQKGDSTVNNGTYSYDASTFEEEYAWNTTQGKLASTTGNIYGIYDMSGGAYEYVASYVNNNSASTYGQNVVNGLLRNKQVYDLGTSDTQQNNYNANSDVYGDAVHETSTSYTGKTSWCTDYSSFPQGSYAFFGRGGYHSRGVNAGVFYFGRDYGSESAVYGYRPVLCLTSIDGKQTHLVRYDANGGTLGEVPLSEVKENNVTYTITNKIPTKEGFKFLGWSTNKNAISATYMAGNGYTQNADITLYAVWISENAIIVDGLGGVEVSDPNIELDYDPNSGELGGVVPPVENVPETPAEIPEEKLPEIIEFGYGKFEAKANYTPGTYETVPYETTYTKAKYPVSYLNRVWSEWLITKDANGNVIKTEPGDIELEDIGEQYSTYIVYDFETEEALEANGVKGDSVELWTIFNTSEDTLENAVYLAAYLNKLDGKTSRHIAKWDGSKYIAYNADTQIAAVNTFVETYTEKGTKRVQITAPSTTTEYVYVPVGNLKAEKGMTWAQWLASDYNTTGQTSPAIKTSDFVDVAYTDTIVAGKDYGFMVYELSGTWKFKDSLIRVDETSDGVGQDITFISNGEAFSSMTVVHMHLYIGEHEALVYDDKGVVNTSAWVEDEDYKTVDFGTIPQPVSKEFYDWFTANAHVAWGLYDPETNELKISWDKLLADGDVYVTNGAVYTNAEPGDTDNNSWDVYDGKLVLPNDGSITKIDDYAFYCLPDLSSVVIPDSVTSIGEGAFQYCGDGDFVIPDTITSIGEYVFQYGGFESITVGQGVTDYGKGAFADSYSLKSVTLTEHISKIRPYDFMGSGHLEEIVIPANNSSYCSVDNVVYTKDMKTLVFHPMGKEGTTFTVPDSVTTIGEWAFAGNWEDYGCKLETIIIGENVTEIGEYAFNSNWKLNNVVYKGTKAQWNKINLGKYWNNGTTQVTCSDGTITVK